MPLKDIVKGKQPQPRRVLLYGVHGVGKSTWAAGAPGAIFVPTEDGVADIDCARFPLAKTYQEVLGNLGALYQEKHQYKTVIIDTVDWLERLIWAQVCTKRGVESIEDIGFAKGYTFALTQWREILEGLEALRKNGMTAVLLAHCKTERFENPMTETYDRYVPRLHKHAAALIQEWCDEVLFCTYKVHTAKQDEGFGKKRVQGIGTGERVVYTTERPAHCAKNRLGLPEELPLDYAAYAKYGNGNGNGNGKKKESA